MRASTVDEVLTPRGEAGVSPAARGIAVGTWRFVAFGLLAFWQGGFMFYRENSPHPGPPPQAGEGG